MNIGSIAYVNSLPVDGALIARKISHPFGLVRDVPAIVNQRMIDSDVVAGPMSVLAFLKNVNQFELLPDLSISSRSGVKSVLLRSRVPWRDLSGKNILLTNHGETTPILTRILIERMLGIVPVWSIQGGSFDLSAASAHVIIGDDALRSMENEFRYEYDLAEEWEKWTGTPFVFAVWAIQKNHVNNDPEQASKIADLFRESRQWGIDHPDQIIQIALEHHAMTKEVVENYYRHLRFDLDQDLLKGLDLFIQKCREINVNLSSDFSFYNSGKYLV